MRSWRMIRVWSSQERAWHLKWHYTARRPTADRRRWIDNNGLFISASDEPSKFGRPLRVGNIRQSERSFRNRLWLCNVLLRRLAQNRCVTRRAVQDATNCRRLQRHWGEIIQFLLTMHVSVNRLIEYNYTYRQWSQWKIMSWQRRQPSYNNGFPFRL